MQVFFHHIFTPHRTNNHRARAIHTDALLFYVFFFVVFNFGLRIVHQTHPDILGYATDIRLEQLLSATNARRQAAGLTPLTLNLSLSQAAAGKARDMFAKNYWAHIAPDGKTPWDFIVNSGYQYTIAGENLAKNFSTSDGVVDAWMASQSHKENLLKSGYHDVGFAVVNGILNGEETTLVVQMFGTIKQLAADMPRNVQVNKPTVNNEVETAVVPREVAGQTQGEQRITQPLLDIPTTTRALAFIFGGFLMVLLVVDAWVVAKRKIVRVSGHSFAHTLFLATAFIGMSAVVQGVIL